MWTTENDVVAALHKRWAKGQWLAALAGGTPFEPVKVSLKGPKATDLEYSFGKVQEWSLRWRNTDPSLMRVEYTRIGGRRLGSNEVPRRVWIDTFDRLCELLGTTADAERFQEVLSQTRAFAPRLVPWLERHPMRALELAEHWTEILAAVRWIRERPDTRQLYLRQIDVPGVDTKFIESHRGTLADLLDLVLPVERVDTARPVSSFAARYGFRTKPDYVRFRGLDGSLMDGYTELSVRADEFRLPQDVETVFIVENEITFLAFPPCRRSIVVLGGGYAVAVAARITDLVGLDVVYWGDVDTHGFAILNRLRAHLPRAVSMLMDEDTLLDHRTHWSDEPSPTNAGLEHLTRKEADVYAGLATGRWGRAIRLEQERVRFSHLAAALDCFRGGTG
ncbi:DUF3322 domain-containing protein [Nocardiopsis sp. LOL_012]|uniref:DUF3322 domain-containing protein n=1 Tax=Nocardiopsis sp. LOL_012 TaxID=3345409 RepID=UPI003A8A3EDB